MRSGLVGLLTARMAFHWIIDSKQSLVTAIAEGRFTASDVRSFLSVIVGADALSYRQLFDFAQGIAEISPEEAMDLGARIRMHQADISVGPLAVVLPSRQSGPIARLLGILATAQRPMRIFHKREPAERWLNDLAAAASAPLPEVGHHDPSRPTCL